MKLRIANDYAAVIEGQIAGNIDIALYGPASFARALMNGAKVERLRHAGEQGRHQGLLLVLWVKKDAPYQKIEDLKGKNLYRRPQLHLRQQRAALRAQQARHQAGRLLRQRRLHGQP